MQVTIDTDLLKKTLKEALAETLHEERDYLHAVFAEVLEDYALGEAIREGLNSTRISREKIFSVLEHQ